MSTVELKDVTIAFDAPPVFEHLSLTFRHGEKVTIHGETGSGASVLIKTVSGLIEPQSGTILCDGRPFTYTIDRDFFEQRRSISHLIEDLAPIANLTVFENVALPYRLNTDMNEEEIRGLVVRRLRSVQLEEKAGLRPVKISRDDQIVLCMLMNLKDESGLIVIDESFFNLKDSTINRVRSFFEERLNRKGTTVFMRDVDQTTLTFAPTRKITLRKGQNLSDEVIA